MSDKYYALDQEGMQQTLFKKACLPDIYWDIDVVPRFSNLPNGKVEAQSALNQAQVFNSLLANPKQIVEFPRRWRLAAFNQSSDKAAFVLAKIIKAFILSGIRVHCCIPADLPKVHDDRVDVVFCYNCFQDMERSDLMNIRNAHTRNFHLFYAMDGSYDDATPILRVTPDYVFNVDEISLNRAAKKVF